MNRISSSSSQNRVYERKTMNAPVYFLGMNENGSSHVYVSLCVNLPLTICFNINPREHSIENYG